MTRLYFEKGDAYVCLIARRPANMKLKNKLESFGYKGVRDNDFVMQVTVGNDTAKVMVRDLSPLNLVDIVSQGSSRGCIDAAVAMASIQLSLEEIDDDPAYLEKHFKYIKNPE